MKTKIEKVKKNIGFTVKKIHKAEKQTLNFKKLERERLVLSQQRIRALGFPYSSGDGMRNPYRQAV